MSEKFIEYLRNNGLAENTCNSYNKDVELFKKYYEDSYGEKLDKLVHADISMYYNHLLKTGVTSASVNRKIASLKNYNLFLIDNGIQDNMVILDKDYIKVNYENFKQAYASQKQFQQFKK